MLSRGTDRWSAYGRAGPPTGRAWSVLAIAAVIVGMLVLAASRPHVVGDRPVISYRPDQPGFRRLHGPLDRALARLSVPVRIPAAIGAPSGVYRARGVSMILYGTGSRFGVFRFTADRRARDTRADIESLASECSVCDTNGLVRLAPGIRGAVLAGGNGPNSVTWVERGLLMVVIGPARTFSAERAVAAARALAGVNLAQS